MADDNFYSEENDFQPDEFSAPAKKGMSSGMKVLLIFLGLGGIVFILCCGGLFFAFRSTEFKMTEKKSDIIEIQNEITEITIPDTFQPQAGMSMKIVGMEMKMAIYEEAAKQGALILMSIGTPDDGMVDLEKEFQKNMKQNNQNQRELNITKEEKREFTIKGKKVNFTFAEGTDQNGTKFHQITGVFSGKKGPAFLFIQISDETYNEEVIVKMIESIK